MKKKTTYYFECDFGCSLHEAYNIRQAQKEILQRVGIDSGLKHLRKASEEDIEWVRAMQGYTSAISVLPKTNDNGIGGKP